jgi:hypothetical protein
MSSHGVVNCFWRAASCSWSALRPSKIAFVLWLSVLSWMSANCRAQVGANPQEWGEKFNSAGARLVLKETGRTRSNGRTTVTYSIFASGLPLDVRYVLWTQLVGSDPQPAADTLLTDDGKVVSQLADPQHHILEDPINLKVFAGRGEPKQFGLISSDGKFRAFAQVIPFPIYSSDGHCRLSAVMTEPNYYGVFISISGFQASEDLIIDTRSDGEQGQRRDKASDQGTYDSALFPFVRGKRSGKFLFRVTATSCKIGIELPWGDGSYELQ